MQQAQHLQTVPEERAWQAHFPAQALLMAEEVEVEAQQALSLQAQQVVLEVEARAEMPQSMALMAQSTRAEEAEVLVTAVAMDSLAV